MRFQIALVAPGKGGKSTEFAELNERQASLLITYMRNSEKIRAFKKALFNTRAIWKSLAWCDFKSYQKNTRAI